MTIYPVMDDPVLQDLSQEPSTSSKYGLQGPGVLDTLLIMLQSQIMMIHDVKDDPIIQEPRVYNKGNIASR